jgi:cytochrome P450
MTPPPFIKDTTAAALSSFVYFLAKYPLHQEKARAEVLSILGPSADPTLDSLSKMPYLSACIKESLRMNNPSNGSLPRVSREEATMVGGFQVPPRTPVVFNIAAMHRNNAYWANVETFDPTRFLPRSALSLDPSSKKAGLRPHSMTTVDNPAWVSFGAGPRQCPAKSFSLYEQRVMGALLLREYEWTLPPDSAHQTGLRNRFTFSALNSPQDLGIRFVKRS